MSKREELVTDEFYHIYNRGVDKRVVFEDKQDFFQFIQMLDYFNNEKSCGSLKAYKSPANLKHRGETSMLVEIVAYCLNANHYHLILKQKEDGGISRFMQKVNTGYTMFFNKKNKRTGSLFSGVFKSKYIDTDAYLKHVGVYVNLNNKVHKKSVQIEHRGETSTVENEDKINYVSSWGEYVGTSKLKLCKNKDYLLHDFKTIEAYKKFAKETLKEIIENKENMKDLEN